MNDALYLRREPFHCLFYDAPCILAECPAYQDRWRWTSQERQEVDQHLAADVPVNDPCHKDWCMRFNCCVATRYVAEIPAPRSENAPA